MDTVIGLARAYAAHMDGWRAEPAPTDEYGHENRAFLVNDAEQARLRIERGYPAPRLIVSPVFPWRSGVSGPAATSISVSAERAYDAAAKDILRRAVPAAIDGTRQWERNTAAADARKARDDRLRADLAAEFPALSAWPGEEPRFDWRPPQPDEDRLTSGTVKLRTSYRYGPTFEENGYEGDIELRGLPLDVVRRVLRALTEEG